MGPAEHEAVRQGAGGGLLRGRLGWALRKKAAPGFPEPGLSWAGLWEKALSSHDRDVSAFLAALRTAAGETGTAVGVLAAAPPSLWLALDGAVRRSCAVTVPENARGLRLVLQSMDRDGRRREAAVLALAQERGAAVAYALALRCVDWVKPVREAARVALLAHLEPDEGVPAVQMLLRLQDRARAEGVLEEFRAALTDPVRRRTVRRLAADEDRRARRFGMELALELGEYVRGDLVRTALRDEDQVCRGLCAQALLEMDPDQAGRLMWARSAAVRRLAVAALPDDVPAARLVGPLADRSRMVREEARWRLYDRGEPPVEVYRRQLQRCGSRTPAHLVAGLAAGLGECGDANADDIPLLARLASREAHPWDREAAGPVWPPAVRRAAVRALGRLARGEELLKLLVPLLGDETPSVAREAFDALLPVAAEVPEEASRAALGRPEAAVRRAALRLVRASGPWRRVEVDLELAADPRPEVVAEARADLRLWLGRQVCSRAEPERLRRIRELLAAAGLPEPLRREMAFVVR
jgi:HEAT repeats